MNRALKLLALIAIAEMVAVQIAVVVARWDWLAHFVALSGYQQRALPALAFLPAWTAFGMVLLSRQLKAPSVELSRDHRRLLQVGMSVTIVFVTAVHNALALSLVAKPLAPGAAPMQLMLLVAGVLTAAYGNYRPKTAAPSGLAAIDPASWGRIALRNGWALVGLGLGEIILAIAAPRSAWPYALALLAPLALLAAASEWRLARSNHRRG